MGQLHAYTAAKEGDRPTNPTATNSIFTAVLNIPESYRHDNINLSWEAEMYNSYGLQSADMVFGYKLPGSTSITETQTSDITLNLTNISQIGIRCRVYYRPAAYVSGGAVTQRYRAQGHFIITVPWGGIDTETIITAEKLNEFATKSSVSVSAISGQIITRDKYAAIASALGYNNLDLSKPLLTDLEALASLTPISWSSTNFDDI